MSLVKRSGLSMIKNHRHLRCLANATVLLALGSSWGCSEELGPEGMRTTSVHGKITQTGRAIDGGWIEFLPADGTVGNLRSAQIKPDGTFSADRVPIGSVAIRLLDVNIIPPFPVNARTARGVFASYTAIRRKIPEQPSELNLDLLDALIESQARKANAAAAAAGDAPGAQP